MNRERTIAILATLDTKSAEARFIRSEIEAQGGRALFIDLGLLPPPPGPIEYGREEVLRRGGADPEALFRSPTRQSLAPVLIRGAISILHELRTRGLIHGALALGGTQGTSNGSQILQSLPYGFPKVMLSTIASGDVKPFVGIKDVTMMFSVADILGLNALSRAIFANAAGAALGMARAARPIVPAANSRGVIAMTNLGVLTQGAMRALARFEIAGYEVITFHAIGAGGRAMEHMMKEGLIQGVFDYALGELADEMFDGLRAADAERLTVAARLGLPQVVVPGGAEHVGVLLAEPNTTPARWAAHRSTFHNPYVFVPRLGAEELTRLGQRIGERLAGAGQNTVFLMPLRGVSRYSRPGGELEDREADLAFWTAIDQALPRGVRRAAIDANAEDDAFVDQAVDTLLSLLGAR